MKRALAALLMLAFPAMAAPPRPVIDAEKATVGAVVAGVPVERLCHAGGVLDTRFGDKTPPFAMLIQGNSIRVDPKLAAIAPGLATASFDTTEWTHSFYTAQFGIELVPGKQPGSTADSALRAAEAAAMAAAGAASDGHDTALAAYAKAQLAGSFVRMGWSKKPFVRRAAGHYDDGDYRESADEPDDFVFYSDPAALKAGVWRGVQATLTSSGTSVVLDCTDLNLSQQNEREREGILPADEPMPVAALPPLPEWTFPGDCATADGQARVMAAFDSPAFASPAARIVGENDFRERRMTWKRSRIFPKGPEQDAGITDEDIAPLFLAMHNGGAMEGRGEDTDKVIGKLESRVHHLFDDETRIATLRAAGDAASACHAANELHAELGWLRAELAPRYDLIENALDALAAKKGVALK